MNDLWMKPIRTEAPDLLELLQLDKVLISRSGTGLTLCLNASRLLTEPEYKRLDRVLSKAVPGYTTKVEVAYPALREEVLRDVTTVSDFLARQLIRRIPGAAPCCGTERSGASRRASCMCPSPAPWGRTT